MGVDKYVTLGSIRHQVNVKLPTGGYLVKDLQAYKAAGGDFFGSNIADNLRPPETYPAVVYFTLEREHGATVPNSRIIAAIDHYDKLVQEIDILRSNF